METLRFLMVSTHFPPYHMGGDGAFVEFLSNELIRRGHEVHVVYNPTVFEYFRKGKPSHRLGQEVGAVRHEFVPRAPVPSLLLTLSTGWSSRAERKVTELANELKPDVVHWHNTKGFIAPPFSIPGAVSLHTTHDYYSVCPRSNLIKPGQRTCDNPRWCQLCLVRWRKPPQLWRVGRRRVLRFDEELRTLCPSEFMARRLREDGINVHRVLRGFVPDPKVGANRMSREDLLVFVGILEKRKGPQTLLEAFARSKDRHGFNLVIVGEGHLREHLEMRVKDLRLSNRVTLPGFLPRERLEATLRKASFMVIPSEWSENAPSTALEAFSFGVPVVGTTCGGLPEMLTPDSGSILFEAGHIGELSEILASIWHNRSEIDERGARARKTYETRFSPGIHITEYMKLIRNQG